MKNRLPDLFCGGFTSGHRNTRMRRTALLSLLVVGWLGLATSSVATGSDASGDVLAAQHMVADAITHQDYDKLDKLLGEDLLYCHASARVDTKASFLKALRAGELKYLKVESDDARARVSGDLGIINGHFLVQTEAPDGKPRTPDHSWVTMVYAKRDGRWLLISYQATHAPVNSIAAPATH
jgi:ketosteroid isomerase-like protein